MISSLKFAENHLRLYVRNFQAACSKSPSTTYPTGGENEVTGAGGKGHTRRDGNLISRAASDPLCGLLVRAFHK